MRGLLTGADACAHLPRTCARGAGRVNTGLASGCLVSRSSPCRGQRRESRPLAERVSRAPQRVRARSIRDSRLRCPPRRRDLGAVCRPRCHRSQTARGRLRGRGARPRLLRGHRPNQFPFGAGVARGGLPHRHALQIGLRFHPAWARSRPAVHRATAADGSRGLGLQRPD